MTPNKTPRRSVRRATMALAAVAVVAGTGCSDFLEAENPGAIEEKDLNDAAYVSLLANAPIGSFQNAQDDLTYWNAQFTDELQNRNDVNPFVEEGQIDRRELYSDMSYIPAFLYNPMQRARYLAEDAVRRLTTILGDSASRDLRIARAHAYGGYSYLYLGEAFCETPIDLSAPKPSQEMYGDALTHFENAITIATAARSNAQSKTPVDENAVAAADSVINFALVGSARASLNRNELAQASTFAQQVPEDFVFSAYYSANTSAQHHRTYNRLGIGNNATLTNTPFEAMADDPRIPRWIDPEIPARLGTPLSPPSYSTYSGEIPGAPFAEDMSQRLASGLEARYIIAEAAGPTAATLAFVNERRAAGNQVPVSLAGDALMAELRDQRARDFYLDNHRLGDLRRYKEFYNIDLFPKGPYPGSTTGQVYDETITCWPLPTSELNANPNARVSR